MPEFDVAANADSLAGGNWPVPRLTSMVRCTRSSMLSASSARGALRSLICETGAFARTQPLRLLRCLLLGFAMDRSRYGTPGRRSELGARVS